VKGGKRRNRRNRKIGQAMKRREGEKRKEDKEERGGGEEEGNVNCITKDTAIGEGFHTTRSWRNENEASGNLTWYAAGHAHPLLTSAW